MDELYFLFLFVISVKQIFIPILLYTSPQMRIFVTAPDDTGTLRKTRLTLVDCTTSNDLLKRLSSLCHIHQQWIIAKIKQDLVNIRIIQGWNLDIYPLKQGSQIIVENLPQPTKSSPSISSPSKLLKIDEELELQMEDNSTSGVGDQKLSFFSESNDHDWTKYFEESLQQFLDAIRKNQIQNAANILKSQPSDCTDQRIINRIMPKKVSFLLNQVGDCGRTALHWAVQEKNLDMVEFLLIKSCNPNSVSIDNYTPLQLSIVLKASSIFQTLVSHPKIDLNKITKKGTALHLSFEYSLVNYAQKLIDHGADLQLQNSQGVSCLDLYKKLNLKGIKIKNNQSNPQQLPFILRGYVNRVSGFASRLKQRLLVVNPFSNEFVLFEDKKAEQNIDLDSITQINFIKNKSWGMKKQFYYFSIKYNNQQIVFCLFNHNIGVQWVQNLRKCTHFCLKKSHRSKFTEDLQLVMVLDDKKNDIKVHKRKKTTNSPQQTSRLSKEVGGRISLFDLQPKQEEKQSRKQKIEDIKKEQIQVNYSQIINESSIFPSPGAIIEQQSDYNNFRQSQLIGSVLANNLFSKSTIKPDYLNENSMQERTRPLVCYKDFQILKQLGLGSFGKVFLARHRREQKLYALKVLNKKKLIAKKQIRYAVGQANILKKVNSPFIIKLYYSFQTPSNLYIAIDYCANGDLSQRIIQTQECLNENVCRFVIAQVILAVQYLHKNNIIYRDLKPENILIGQDGFIRLADFNLSKQNHFSTSFCGSPAYLSPQMLQKKGVGPEADIYGIGCVLYEMMVGEPPFFDENIDSLYDNIKNSRLKFPAGISKSAKSLISALLERNIKKRIGVKDINQIKNHQFFEGFDWKKLEKLQLEIPAQLSFKNADNLGLIVIQSHGLQDADYENNTAMINRIKNFTFARQTEIQQNSEFAYL